MKLKLLLFFSVIMTSICTQVVVHAQPSQLAIAKEGLSKLEKSANGHLGVFAINTTTNKVIEYHADQRFPFCSTSKVMGVSAFLKVSETEKAILQKKIRYQKSDLVMWSPTTEKYVNSGMTNASLCEAAITHSDNTAINLLLKQIGGPKAVTSFARSIGDNRFIQNRTEPELNSAIPGDIRDTSTPKAMVNSLHTLVLGNVLAPTQRKLLKTWLLNNTTGRKRIRAGAPKGWVVADKTGSCGHYGVTNDVAVVWQENGTPIVIAIYFTQKTDSALPRNDVVASAAQTVLESLKNS